MSDGKDKNSTNLSVAKDKFVQIRIDFSTPILSFQSHTHTDVEYGRKQGDLRVDNRYVFEVGGEAKDYAQIADLPDSYILADNLEYASGHKLPLWMIGLLY